ncbi:MAG: alanine--glyoxylate aminotransferase family protein [Planctomycetes bacterium]|nr:alanine--glyoxylate aminotransferase family protein [Planctomycetota bacterium]
MTSLRPNAPPLRILLGPGPSECAPEVLAALARPTLGHLDPLFLSLMDEVRAGLRAAYRTENELAFPISGTGTAGMEAVLVNLLERDDAALVGVAGYFGARLAEIARRVGARVTEVRGEWGRALSPDDMRRAAGGKRFKILALVHGETSTGVVADLAAMRAVADELGALLVADCVTTLGGMPLEIDAWGVDGAYAGTQKCLAAPAGLSPVTLSARALASVAARKTPITSWYFDLALVKSYWSQDRAYHHTAPIQNIYALHEALRLLFDEGLAARWQRHARHARALWAGLTQMGLALLVPEAERLVPLTAVRVPTGIDEARVRRFLLERYSLEIGGGLGELKGRIWRIGLMGAGSKRANVELVLSALRAALAEQGWTAAADPLPAVHAAYANA